MSDSFTIWFDRRPTPELADLVPADINAMWSDSDDHLDGIEQADGLIAGASIIYDESVFKRAADLRVLARMGIGFDNVVLDDATAAGVAACNTPDGPTISTAEHALALIFAITKQLKESERQLQRQEGNYVARHNALELDGANLTLIGLGRIGSRVARVAIAAGLRVSAYDPFESAELFETLGVRRFDDLQEAVSEAQIISIHAPLNSETRHLVDTDLISNMLEGVFIVNTARGALVDDDALLEGLNAGKIRGAGIDVTDPEPLPAGHPLLEHESVLVTPHVASATTAGRKRIFTMALDQILTAFAGSKPSHILNPAVWSGQ